MEGVYLLRPNGTITSLLGSYSKNFEEEAFKEFGDKTKQFGHLFNTDFIHICNRKVFSFDVRVGTRLSFVFNGDYPSLAENPTPSQLFTVAFKSFTSKLLRKTKSSAEFEEPLAFEPEARVAPNLVNTGYEVMSLTDLFRSSELLLRLAFDYENYVASQPDPIFPTPDWESMLGKFKDEIRLAAVRSSCTLAAQLNSVESQLASAKRAMEASRATQNERSERIEYLSKAVQTLSLQLEKNEQNNAIISSQQSISPTLTKDQNISVSQKEEENLPDEKKSKPSEVEDFSHQRQELSTNSKPVAEEKNVKVTNELEKLLLASKHAIFYLQRDLEEMKLERDSYYHQILELRRARQIYESKRHQEMTEIPPAEPPGFMKKKPKVKGVVATANGKTKKLNGQAGQMKGPNLKPKFNQGEE